MAADSSMTFRGPLSSINTALNGLAFLPSLNYTGPALLQVVSNDLGNFATGGALSDTDTVTITVNAVVAVNDAPVNSVSGSQSVNEDAPLVFSVANGNAISVSDVDDADNGTLGDETVQVVLTAGKAEKKQVYTHSGYPGGIKSTTYGDLLARKPEDAVRRTVRGMLPKNRLGRQMISKLKVYSGPEHPHGAQKPETLEVDGARAKA